MGDKFRIAIEKIANGYLVAFQDHSQEVYAFSTMTEVAEFLKKTELGRDKEKYAQDCIDKASVNLNFDYTGKIGTMEELEAKKKYLEELDKASNAAVQPPYPAIFQTFKIKPDGEMTNILLGRDENGELVEKARIKTKPKGH